MSIFFKYIRNYLKFSITVILIFFCTACTFNFFDKSTSDKECTFDDGKNAAPSYFCTLKVNGVAKIGKGFSAKSTEGMDLMVQQATQSARKNLGEKIRNEIQISINKIMQNDKTIYSQDFIDSTSKLISQDFSDEALNGARIVRQLVGPKGEVYIFVGIDTQTLISKKQEAIIRSINNKRELWQQIQSSKSLEQWSKEIAEDKTINSNIK